MKYLIVRCDELGDQYECDANREPVCMTDNYDKYGFGYEVYELQPDGTFELIKDYCEALEEGIAVCCWDKEADAYEVEPTVLTKFVGKTKEEVTKSMIKKLKKDFHLPDTVEEIFREVRCGGDGCEVGDKWIAIGRYFDTDYTKGY